MFAQDIPSLERKQEFEEPILTTLQRTPAAVTLHHYFYYLFLCPEAKHCGVSLLVRTELGLKLQNGNLGLEDDVHWHLEKAWGVLLIIR